MKTSNYLRYMMESVAETTKVMDQLSSPDDKKHVHDIWANLSVALDEFLSVYETIENQEDRDLFLDRLMSQMNDLDEEELDSSPEIFKFPTTKVKAEA